MAEKQRIMSIDYGDARTGIAVSDETRFLASGVTTIKATGDAKLIEQLRPLIEQYAIGEIVIGDPINMNGTRGPRSEKAHALAEKIRLSTSLPVTMYDERATTVVAHTIMNATNTRGQKRKNTVDTLSAEIILQNYLDSLRNH